MGENEHQTRQKPLSTNHIAEADKFNPILYIAPNHNNRHLEVKAIIAALNERNPAGSRGYCQRRDNIIDL